MNADLRTRYHKQRRRERKIIFASAGILLLLCIVGFTLMIRAPLASIQSVVATNLPTVAPISFATLLPRCSTVSVTGLPTPTRNGLAIANAARAQVGVTTGYDDAYLRIAYPNGDVPLQTGVCTDVIIRAFRKIGVDLQVLVHEDMTANFSAYPKDWGLTRPDANIDHRRVPNLMKYFERKGKSVPISGAYVPGDVVAWRLSTDGWMTHIGVVSSELVPCTNRYLIVHNIGAGTHEQDALNWWTIIGHYRW